MAVVEAKIQTVEDIYRLVWTAVANKRCLRAIYKELPRYSVPTGWAEIRLANFACSVINSVVKVRAAWRRSARRQIGAAWRSRDSEPWNWWTVPGRPPRTIAVRLPASWKPTSMRRINRSALRSAGSEEVARADGGREPSSGS
jgi:hypothetical protein